MRKTKVELYISLIGLVTAIVALVHTIMESAKQNQELSKQNQVTNTQGVLIQSSFDSIKTLKAQLMIYQSKLNSDNTNIEAKGNGSVAAGHDAKVTR